MICPVCVKENEKSTVTVGASATHCTNPSPHYDENGDYHLHDRSATTTFYRCSRGHIWSTARQCGSCRCGWKAQKNPSLTVHEMSQDVEVRSCELG